MENHKNEMDIPQVYLLGKTYLTNNEKFYIRNDPVVHMAAGDRHTIIITTNGRAYAFGDNNSGQLGLGHTKDVGKVSCIKRLKFGDTGEKVILAACGRESSLVATNHGSLYAFGSNHRCQLGIESKESRIIYRHPVKIDCFHSNISWKQLSMGAEHACALTTNGKVYIWGSNEHGQCGQLHSHNPIRIPSELRLEYSVIAISCGYFHTGLISEDGRLFLFGNNADKQLGCSVPDQFNGPIEVSLPSPVKAVACGHQHTVVLAENGNVYACGKGNRGQLGLGYRVSTTARFEIIKNLPKHLTAIAVGEAHTAILGPHGDIYVFGDGRYGKLNNETHFNEYKPCFIDKFKGYNVLQIVCGGCQTIVLAEKSSDKKDEDIEDTSHQSVKSLKDINYSKHSPLYIEPKSDPIDLSASMKSLLMNTTHVEMNGKLQSTETSLKSRRLPTNNEDFESLKTGVCDRRIPFINVTNELTKRENNSDDEMVSFEELSIQNNQTSSSDESNTATSRCSSMIRSTSSGRTSSSISSLDDENQIRNLEASNDVRSSAIEPFSQSATTNELQPGVFSRVLGLKPSQKVSTTNNTISKTCSIM